MFIPRLINPAEDEILYSYLVRLSDANAFSYFADFIGSYLRPNSDMKLAKYFVQYDANTVAGQLLRFLPDSINPAEFYLQHSIYPAIAPLRSKQQQTHIINLAEGRQEQYPRLVTKINSMIPELHVCPECMKEDVKRYGFWYYHRMHQIEGVKVCCRHSIPLHIYKGNGNHVFDSGAPFEEIKDIQSKDHEYARFACDFLNAGYDTDIFGTARAVFKRVQELGYDTASYDRLEEDIADKGYRYFFSKNVRKILKIDLISPQYIKDPDIISLLLALFGNASEVGKYLPKEDPTDRNRFADSILAYTLNGKYRNTIVSMISDVTGRMFITTPSGFLSGWKDPELDMGVSEDDKIREIFDMTSDGKYDYITPFNGMNDKITLRHLECHNTTDTFTTTPRGFLEEGVRCICENRIMFNEAAEMIRKCGDFELVQYETADRDCIIRHLSCGKTFIVNFRKFIKNPYCRAEKPFERTYKSFRQEIKNLTGREYTLTGSYVDKNTKVTIKHNVCGGETEYLPRHFLDGQRCPFCSREIPEKEFPDMVKTATFGKFIITKRLTYNMYEILNTETSETQKLTKAKIIQEINRPTESPLLPCGNRMKILPKKTVKDRIWDYILANYGKDDYVMLQDIVLDGIDRKIIKARVQDLANKDGRIKNVAMGIYTFPDKIVDAKELENAKKHRKKKKQS